MALEFVRDPNAAPIPALAPDDTSVAEVTIAAGNNRGVIPAGATIIEVATQDYCRMAFGNSTVDATTSVRRLHPPGISVYKVPAFATHFAVTQIGASTGVCTVTKLI